MSIELMCSILKLPTNRWPPDHYTLLGLAPSDADPVCVEERVLERMERLRPYQLAHPEAVTDAMNRLAQALVCLTDPDARRAYDANLQQASTAPPLAGSIPEALSEPYPLAPVEPIVRIPSPVPRHQPFPTRRHGDALRRRLYRERVAARRLRSAWSAAGRILADANRRLRQPIEAVELVAALWEVRQGTECDAAPPVGHTGQAGALVGALARQPHILHTFRHLLPDQRTALAADWQAGARRIEEELRLLHGQLQRPPLHHLRRALRRIGRTCVTDRLGLTLFVLGLIALGIALCRSW